MDSRIRALERRWTSGETTTDLAILYFTAVRRMGGKIRLKRFPTPQVGIHVRRGREQGAWFWYVANENVKPGTRCAHKHNEKRNAVKCARRYAYNVVLASEDAELIQQHLLVGG